MGSSNCGAPKLSRGSFAVLAGGAPPPKFVTKNMTAPVASARNTTAPRRIGTPSRAPLSSSVGCWMGVAADAAGQLGPTMHGHGRDKSCGVRTGWIASRAAGAKAGLRETVGKFVSAIVLLIGYLMAAFRQDKRALHDFLFSSQVTHEPK